MTRLVTRLHVARLTPRLAALAVPLALGSSAKARAQLGTDSIVAAAKSAIGTLHDSVSLRAAGFSAIGFGSGVKDLSPFQGQHWISIARFLANQPVQVAQPTFLMYLPVHDSLIPIGVAYTRRIPADSALPTTLAGVKTEWHSHAFCRNIPGEGLALADGPDDCRARGGRPAPNQIAMVHAWTIPNPDGPYAHDNPALPFIATGLTPPVHATTDDRRLGVALGETYGAMLPIAHRIEIEATRAGKAAPLAAPRATLRALAAQLRDAEHAHDAKREGQLRSAMIATYDTLAAVYRSLAATPEIRARYDVELHEAIDGMSHMRM